jgi:hypothetical protein
MAKNDARGIAVPIKILADIECPGGRSMQEVDGKLFLQSRRVAWLEQRHRAGLGVGASATDWIRDMGKVIRTEHELLAITPELEYLFTNVLHLNQHICANSFTAMRSAEAVYFRNYIDGPVGHPVKGMFPSDGSVSIFPTDYELDKILESADDHWDTGTVAVAVMLPPRTLQLAMERVAAAQNAVFPGYGNYWQWHNSLTAGWGRLERFLQAWA